MEFVIEIDCRAMLVSLLYRPNSFQSQRSLCPRVLSYQKQHLQSNNLKREGMRLCQVDTVMLWTNGSSDVVLSGVTVIADDDEAV